MRHLLQILLRKPVMWLAAKLSSSPRQKEVFDSLSKLLENIIAGKQGQVAPIPFDMNTAKLVILSDQHKGARDAADDFVRAEENYIQALRYYYDGGFTLVNLGDCEELWEASPQAVMEKNRLTLLEEARFHASSRYYRVFGNHDLEWKYKHQLDLFLRPLFGKDLNTYEGLLLTTQYNDNTYSVFLTHGHQGDRRSDGNAFSMWFVAAIWTPIQRFLEIAMDTIVDSFELVDKHNIMMYEWSATQDKLLFVSGHTHKPVFASLDHIDRLNSQLEKARRAGDRDTETSLLLEIDRRKLEYEGKKLVRTMVKPSYFNTGCCCFSDGDLTGIEIENGFIRLVKWKANGGGGDRIVPGESASSAGRPDVQVSGHRIVLEESPLYYIFDQL